MCNTTLIGNFTEFYNICILIQFGTKVIAIRSKNGNDIEHLFCMIKRETENEHLSNNIYRYHESGTTTDHLIVNQIKNILAFVCCTREISFILLRLIHSFANIISFRDFYWWIIVFPERL